MKKLLMLVCVFVSAAATAQGIRPSEHAAVLQRLVGKIASPAETRTYYFADSGKKIIEIMNSESDISVNMKTPGTEDLSMTLGNTEHSAVRLTMDRSGELRIQQTEYFIPETSRQVFLIMNAVMTSSSVRNTTVLSARAEKRVYWDYDASAPQTEKWHWVSRKVPSLSTSDIQAQLILSLSAEDTKRMGKLAAARVKESRDPGEGSCSMESSRTMKCEWSLETNYTPDTLRGTFSIKNGKIDQLVKTEVEPGC